jgi:hypothetical protein
MRRRGIGHQAALRQLSNRLVGILYNEHCLGTPPHAHDLTRKDMGCLPRVARFYAAGRRPNIREADER